MKRNIDGKTTSTGTYTAKAACPGCLPHVNIAALTTTGEGTEPIRVTCGSQDATTYFTLGTKTGTYHVTATCPSCVEGVKTVVFTSTAEAITELQCIDTNLHGEVNESLAPFRLRVFNRQTNQAAGGIDVSYSWVNFIDRDGLPGAMPAGTGIVPALAATDRTVSGGYTWRWAQRKELMFSARAAGAVPETRSVYSAGWLTNTISHQTSPIIGLQTRTQETTITVCRSRRYCA